MWFSFIQTCAVSDSVVFATKFKSKICNSKFFEICIFKCASLSPHSFSLKIQFLVFCCFGVTVSAATGPNIY